MSIINKDIKFTYTQRYDYNESQIEIQNGSVKLVGTGGLYYTSNPFFELEDSVLAESINSFTETATPGTGNLIKYIVSIDGESKYWAGTGTIWSSSNGTYSQSNLATEINSNCSTLLTTRGRLGLKCFLHSYNGTTTPELDNINISYNISSYSLPDDVRSSLIGIDKGNLTNEDIMTHIELANNTIDYYISGQYDLPVTDISALKLLRTFSIIIASYNIYSWFANKEGTNVNSLAVKRYEKTIETLEAIQKGEQSLTGLTNVDKFTCSTIDYDPVFNMGSIYDMGVDSDQIESGLY